MPEPTLVTFPRGAWAALAVAGALLVGGIVTQVLIAQDQRVKITDQRAIARRQARQALPLLRETRPLVDAVSEGMPGLRDTGQRFVALTRELTPLAADLRAARLPQTTRAVGVLAAQLVEGDAPATLQALRSVGAEMLRQDRLRRLLVRGDQVFAQLRVVVPRQYETLRQSLSIQRSSLALQRQSLAIQREALAVARETLRHAESIDRKTGGPAPAPPVAPLP